MLKSNMGLTNEQLVNVLKTKILVDSYGSTFYTLNGLFHREDGPAIVYSSIMEGFKQALSIDGKRWFLHGKEYSEEEYNDIMTNTVIKK